MSKQLIVKKSKLNGKITLSGAKNSALRLLAASLLTDDEIFIPQNAQSIPAVKIFAFLELEQN